MQLPLVSLVDSPLNLLLKALVDAVQSILILAHEVTTYLACQWLLSMTHAYNYALTAYLGAYK